MKVAQYSVGRILGRGAMAVVYEAVDRSGAKVALKILFEGADPDAQRRFEREGRIVKNLQHPNICRVMDTGYDDEGKGFIAMELIDGRDVATRLAERGRFSTDEAVDIAIQAATALKYAHERGVFHRDIKPSNLMIENGGRVVVADFGIARSVFSTAVTRTGMVTGTLAYMAPEVLRSEAPDARVDLYALGVTLYEMLTGANPYRGETAEQTMYRVLNHTPPNISRLNRDVPRWLEAFLERALQKDRNLRFQSADEFIYHLQHQVHETRRWNRKMVAVLGGSFIFVLVLGGLLRSGPASVSTHSAANLPHHKLAPDKTPMVFVEGGMCYVMGASEPHQVDAFYIDEHEVTNGQLMGMLRARHPELLSRPELQDLDDDLPCRGLPLSLYMTYANWRGATIPSIEQFTRAARGDSRAPYPWGTSADDIGELANCSVMGPGKPVPPEQYQKGARNGIYDLCGNVAEWVRVRSNHSVPPVKAQYAPVGGSYRSPPGVLNLDLVTDAVVEDQNTSYPDAGFRCVMGVDYPP